LSGALRRNGDEILEALDDAVIKLKRALKDRSETQSEHIRRTTRDNREFDSSHTDSDAGGGGTTHHSPNSGGSGGGRRSGVNELEVGSYGELQYRARPGDGMQHDHVPSKAALLRALQQQRRRMTPAQRRYFENEATAIEISDALHYRSRTYGGRQNQQIPDGNGSHGPRVDVDADDVDTAMWRDLAQFWENTRSYRNDLDEDDVLDAIQEVVNRNRDLFARLNLS